MGDLTAFPKIFHIGERWIKDIFDGPVEITEKVDGSQFVFGMVDGELKMRSKGKAQYAGAVDKMFLEAHEYVSGRSVRRWLVDGYTYYCEYLRQPKHNVLTYNSTPKNYLYLFGVETPADGFIHDRQTVLEYADRLDISPANVLHYGESSPEHLREFLDLESFLGGPKVEGVVVKNYNKSFMLGDRVFPIMSGKFVSEAFKEKHQKNWTGENTSGGKWGAFCDGYRSEARWQKAVQHLREEGRLDDSPKDIGALIKEVNRDIEEEEVENIKDFLYAHFGRDLKRKATAGLPEWYKSQISGVPLVPST